MERPFSLYICLPMNIEKCRRKIHTFIYNMALASAIYESYTIKTFRYILDGFGSGPNTSMTIELEISFNEIIFICFMG